MLSELAALRASLLLTALARLEVDSRVLNVAARLVEIERCVERRRPS
jgi:hypothetical protein